MQFSEKFCNFAIKCAINIFEVTTYMDLMLSIITLFGSVAMLMYGMKVMSEGLQKMAGSKLSHVLSTMTTNRFTGVLTGAFITASIQSSTATTVMTVSFVSTGILTLAQAISVIMGANIGTTFTAWIMVLGGGSFDMRLVIYFLIVLAVIFIYTKKYLNSGEFLIGLALLLLGLTTLKMNANDMHLDQLEPVKNFFIATSQWGYGSYLLYLVVGGILTTSVQSSAAIMAITMTLCSAHVLPIDMGIALILGENIGTTITANVVALSASTQARRAALAHLVFNVFGVLWVLCIFRWFVSGVCRLWSVDFVPGIPSDVSPDKLNAILATFHTVFNVTNTLILIWFIPQIEKLVCWFLQPNPDNKEEEGRLKFISGGLMSTSELSIIQAWREIYVFAERAHRMIGMVKDLYETTDETKFNQIHSRIDKYENICDHMEVEIAAYLGQVIDGRLSDQSKKEIQKMMRIVSELESVGDANYNLARYLTYRHRDQLKFTEEQNRNVETMNMLLSQASGIMLKSIEKQHITEDEFNDMSNLENEINNFRDDIKAQNTLSVTEHQYDYLTGINYMDTISEYEKMGDYIINVEEAIYEHKHDK